MLETILPEGWPTPRGYANGIAARGRTVFVAGQIGWDSEGNFATGFAGQFARTLDNILAVVAAAGGRPEDVAQMTWYVLDIEEYKASLAEIGPIWRSRFGRHYPAMAVVCVAGLVEAAARLEIEATAVIAD